MIVGLAQDLDAAGIDQSSEAIENVGAKRRQLLHHHPGKRVRGAEFRVLLEQAKNDLIGGEIGFASDSLADMAVVERGPRAVVEVLVVMTDAEKRILLDAKRLMNLEIKTNRGHFAHISWGLRSQYTVAHSRAASLHLRRYASR